MVKRVHCKNNVQGSRTNFKKIEKLITDGFNIRLEDEFQSCFIVQQNAGGIAKIPVVGHSVLIKQFTGLFVAGDRVEAWFSDKCTFLRNALPNLEWGIY